MGRPVLLILLILSAYAFWVGDVANPLERQIRGPWLDLRSQELEARFLRGASVSETLQILDSRPEPSGPGLHNLEIAGLRAAPRPWLAWRHADFYLCDARGGRQLGEAIQLLRVVAADGRVRRTLDEAVERRRAGGNGEVCFQLEGERLHLDAAQLRSDGRDVTSQLRERLPKPGFVYARSATLVECRSGPATPGA